MTLEIVLLTSLYFNGGMVGQTVVRGFPSFQECAEYANEVLKTENLPEGYMAVYNCTFGGVKKGTENQIPPTLKNGESKL